MSKLSTTDLQKIYTSGSAQQLWEAWDEKMRTHFLIDHAGQFFELMGDDYNKSAKAYNTLTFDTLPAPIRKELVIHHAMGMYSEGGNIRTGTGVFQGKEFWRVTAKGIDGIAIYPKHFYTKEAAEKSFREKHKMDDGGSIEIGDANENKQITNMKKITVLYNFNHPKMGFQNSITVEANDNEDAIRKAEKAVSETYGSNMLKRFSFTVPDKMAKGSEISNTTVTKITYPTERLPVEKQSIEERELQLFIENDADLYRQRTVPIHTNLVTKIARGVFDINKAPLIYKYLIDDAIKKYNKDYGGGMELSKSEKDNLTKTLTNEFLDEAQYGNYENYLPKKYQSKNDDSMGKGGSIPSTKQKMQDRINILKETQTTASSSAQKAIQAKIDKLQAKMDYKPTAKQLAHDNKGRFALDVPTKYSKAIYKKLWSMKIMPRIHKLNGTASIVVSSRNNLDKAYKVYSDVSSEKVLPLAKISRKL